MKLYLTENGLLVVRDDVSFFTSNSGEFRRVATQDEVEYLRGQLVPIDMQYEKGAAGRLSSFVSKLCREVPLWHYLWSVRSSDYSSYKPETCNNGGDYAFHTVQHFFARYVDDVWEIRTVTTHETSSEFEYDELSGRFQTSLNCLTAIGIAPRQFEDENGAYEEESEFYVLTQTANGEDKEIALGKLLDEQNYTLEEAINAQGYYIPEADSEGEEGFLPLEEAELQRRQMIADYLGITDKPTRGSGRNKRI